MAQANSFILAPSPLDFSGHTAHNFNKRTLTMNERSVIEISERAMSTISMVASLFVLATFMAFSNLRAKLVNRLIFYATWGNLATNVATLISVSGIKRGPTSALCQTQGFFIQWFMPADCLWAFCLALNVFLTFHTFRGRVKNIRSLEPYYFAFCYGLPFIPALVYLVLDVAYSDDIYGDATIWCWVTEKHRALRVATFYGPVWVVISCTTLIYVIIGWGIWRDRARVRKASTASASTNLSADGVTEIRLGGILVSKELTMEEGPMSPVHADPFTALNTSTNDSDKAPSVVAVAGIKRKDFSSIDSNYSVLKRDSRPSSKHSSVPGIFEGVDADKSAAKIATTVTAATTPGPDIDTLTSAPRMNTQTMRGAKTYAQVAFMLFLIMAVVWIPSTINRLYTFIHPTRNSFGLNLAASIVLPLQGFFNCVIYVMTSRQQMRVIFRDLWYKLRGIQEPVRGPSIITHPSIHGSLNSPRGGVFEGLQRGATPDDLDKFMDDYERFQRRTGSRSQPTDDIEELEMSVGFGGSKFAQQSPTPRRKMSGTSAAEDIEQSPGFVSVYDDQASLVPSAHYGSTAALNSKHHRHDTTV